MFITFFDEIGNSKTFEANLQNSSRRPVESRGRAIEILQGGPPEHSHKCYYFAQPAVLQAEEKRARNSVPNVPVSCFSQPIGQWLAQAA